MSDLQLVRRYARAKDAEAFAEAVHLYQTMVVATCRRVCFEAADVEDAAQEVFLRMAQGAGDIRSNLGAWLHRCAVNVAHDLNRSRHRQRRRETTAGISAGASAEDHQAALVELQECVDVAMQRLDEQQRDLLVHRFFLCRQQVEMAKEAGVSPATMARRLADAVEALRRHLSDLGGGTGAISIVALDHWLEGQGASARVPAPLTARLMKIGLSGTGKTAAAGFKTGAGVALALAGVIGAGAWLTQASHAPRQSVAATSPASTEPATMPAAALPPDKVVAVRRLIYELRISPLTSDADHWAGVLKSLVAAGPEAVPEIIAELDRAPNDSQMRAMAFALRAIGDKRAIPALLRALPRTSEQSSDFGLSLLDRDLWAFMRKNDVDPGPDQYPRFGYARAVRQVNAALISLTSHDVGEKAFFNQQQRNSAFLRWQTWWAANAQRFPETQAFEKITVGPDTVAEAGRGMIFPLGADVHLGPVIDRELEPQGRLDSRAYVDLDTGRVYESLEGFCPQTQAEADECYAYWLPTAGIDAMADRAIRVDGGEQHGSMILGGKQIQLGFRLSGQGVRVWPVVNDLWESIDALVHSSQLNLPTKVQSDFYPRDKASDASLRETATYLFTTRQGARGILQTLAHHAEDGTFHIRYRLWEGTGKAPSAPPTTRPAITVARFGAEKEVRLGAPLAGEEAGLDFDTGNLAELPLDAELPPFSAPGTERLKAFENLTRWAQEQGVDAVSSRDTRDVLVGVKTLNARVAEVRQEAWTQMTASHAAELVRREFPKSEGFILGGTPPRTYVIQTKSGTLAMVQIVEITKNPECLHLRYRLIELQQPTTTAATRP